MKKTVLTLAAVLALSGTAFAGTNQPTRQTPVSVCVHTSTNHTSTNVKLDCGTTGSVEKTGTTTKTDAAKGPRLGIDINPWIVPSTF